jgi:uncharacterized membrane protein
MFENPRETLIEKRQERMLAFFDAVLAIAITVMALEIAVPALSHFRSAATQTFLLQLTGYLISFVVLGMVWYIHTNFFTYYSFVGSTREILLHFVLMFLITLFQPVTRALGIHPADWGVKALYLGLFLAINAINLGILFMVKRENDAAQEERDGFNEAIKEAMRNNPHPGARDITRMMRVMYHIKNPARLMASLKDQLPEEYRHLLEDYQAERTASYLFSLRSTWVWMAFVSLAAVGLMTNVWLCYAALAGGMVAVHGIKTRCRIKRRSGEQCDIV